MVNWISLGCGQKKTFEDVISGFGKHCLTFFLTFKIKQQIKKIKQIIKNVIIISCLSHRRTLVNHDSSSILIFVLLSIFSSLSSSSSPRWRRSSRPPLSTFVMYIYYNLSALDIIVTVICALCDDSLWCCLLLGEASRSSFLGNINKTDLIWLKEFNKKQLFWIIFHMFGMNMKLSSEMHCWKLHTAIILPRKSLTKARSVWQVGRSWKEQESRPD